MRLQRWDAALSRTTAEESGLFISLCRTCSARDIFRKGRSWTHRHPSAASVSAASAAATWRGHPRAGLAEVPGLELYGYNRTPQRLEPLCAKAYQPVPIPRSRPLRHLVIGVKPYLVGGVLAEALPSLKPETVVISIAAGVTLHDLRDAVQGPLPCGARHAEYPRPRGRRRCSHPRRSGAAKDVFAMILDLFGLLGSTIVLPEKKFNAFMALVGCGPAYVFHFMDALAEAGVTMGFTRQEALELVTQLVLGSAKLAALPGSHPAILREQVCSPAGVTIAAVNHLDRTAVRGHLIDAVLAAYAKS